MSDKLRNESQYKNKSTFQKSGAKQLRSFFSLKKREQNKINKNEQSSFAPLF